MEPVRSKQQRMDPHDHWLVIWAVWLLGYHHIKDNTTRDIPLRANVYHPDPFEQRACPLIPIL